MIRSILSVALVFAAAANIGCEEKKETKPAETAPAAAAPPSGGAPAAAAPAAPAGGAPAAAAPAGDPGKALAAALGAAAAPPKGDTPCEQAFNGMTAMIEAMEKSMPPGGTSKKNEMPTKEKFMAGCGALPKDMQQCMVMSYAMGHQKECADAQAKMDPATAAKVKELMGKK